MEKDTIALFEHVWERFSERMQGLTDTEWAWEPIDDRRISLKWRLEHIATLLSEERNARWLGVETDHTAIHSGVMSVSAYEAIAHARTAYDFWIELLHTALADDITKPIGEPAGIYSEGSKYSFVLHIADEFIHHTAEAALLRDFYAHRRG